MAAKLKLVVDKLDEVAEANRGLYVEREGKFHLDVDGLEDTAGLKKNRDEILKEKKALEKKLEQYGELTPEEAAKLTEFRQQTEENKAKAAGEWDKLRVQLVDKHTKELEGRDKKLAKKDAALDRYIRQAEARRAIGKAEGTELLLPHVLERIKLVEKDDEYSVIVVDKTGNAQVDSKGNPLSTDDLLTAMKGMDEFKGGFKGPGASGSGAENRPNAAGAGAKVVGRNDIVGFGQNLEGIAKGTTVVQ